MAKVSAGILLFRKNPSLEVLLAHPGGPFFAKKDEGAWSIPKGELENGEEPIIAAKREFAEEIGLPAGDELLELGEITQKGGKVVHAWACEGDLPEDFQLQGNFFEMEWPPRSGRRQQFPEIDKAEFFDMETAARKINAAQGAFLERLVSLLS